MHTDPNPSSAQTQNGLLRKLPRRDRERILAVAKLVNLKTDTILANDTQQMQYVYFPVDCYIGMYCTAAASTSIAVSLVGAEGMLGSELLLGSGQLPGTAIVIGAGSAWRMRRTAFATVVAEHAAIRRRMMRYLHHTMMNLAQHAACSRFHSIESRLARWLLMIHDRAGSDRFMLTQQMLANLLGVHRVGVTLAASALQARNLIDYRRGVISVIDRQGLLANACYCYVISESHYRKSLGK